VLGVSQSLSAGGRVLGPAGGGWVFERLGSAAPYPLAAARAVGADRDDDMPRMRHSG
jgi:hypothetical protein